MNAIKPFFLLTFYSFIYEMLLDFFLYFFHFPLIKPKYFANKLWLRILIYLRHEDRSLRLGKTYKKLC